MLKIFKHKLKLPLLKVQKYKNEYDSFFKVKILNWTKIKNKIIEISQN